MPFPQFQPPPFNPLGQQQSGDLNSVFNDALRMMVTLQEHKQQQQLFGEQMKEMQVKRMLAQAEYGFDLYSVTPEQMAQARTPLREPFSLTSETGAQSETPAITESPNVEGLRAYLEREKKKTGLGIREKEAEARYKESQAGFNEAWARLLSGGAGGGDSQAGGPETIEKDGITYRRTITRQGPQWVPLPPQPIAVNPLTGEAIELPRGGRIVTPPGAQKAADNIQKAKTMRGVIDEQEKLLAQVPSGRLAGNIADFANRVSGVYPEMAAARGMAGILQNMISRIVAGEVGNLSETDLKIVAGLVPKVSGTRAEQSLILQELRTLVDRKEAEAQRIMSGKRGTDQIMERLAKGPNDAAAVPYISTDGGKTWRRK